MIKDKIEQLIDLGDVARIYKVSVAQLVLLGAFVMEECHAKKGGQVTLPWAKKAVRMGARCMVEAEASVSFKRAVEETLRSKAHRREHTLREIRSFMNRLMTRRAELPDRLLSSFTVGECHSLIEEVFSTVRQRRKARVLLHGVFAIGVKRGWCAKNPLDKVDIPPLEEKTIPCLSLAEVQELMSAVCREPYRDCLAPVALMLYAGIRPFEVQRLRWGDIDAKERSIRLSPRQTKTGGARQVSMEPILLDYLREALGAQQGYPLQETKGTPYEGDSDHPICPPNWERKWRKLRLALGWHRKGTKGQAWHPDCLRHTYASFHIMYYRDFNRLQYEMGHRSSQLLRTRYINVANISRTDARRFWGTRSSPRPTKIAGARLAV